MGIERTASVGIYFLIKPQEDIKEKVIKTCTNESCNKFHKESNDKFCSSCGTKIEKLTIETKEMTTNIYTLVEDDKLNDTIFQPAYGPSDNFAVLNFDIDGINSPDLMEYERIIEVMNESDAIALALADEKVQSILKYFETKYGKDSIEIKYGAYSYSH